MLYIPLIYSAKWFWSKNILEKVYGHLELSDHNNPVINDSVKMGGIGAGVLNNGISVSISFWSKEISKELQKLSL